MLLAEIKVLAPKEEVERILESVSFKYAGAMIKLMERFKSR